MDSCLFCDFKNDDKGTILFENDLCVCIENHDKVLVGSCIIIPKAHKVTVFDLSHEEWEATKNLVDKVKSHLDAKYKPDGYNVGWNCGDAGGQDVFHAHLHIIPRYADEPYAGRGIRNWIKREENTRPSLRPGEV
jgi:diadenosine tetraphosphate (Ap4A) HIT family hydrolase